MRRLQLASEIDGDRAKLGQDLRTFICPACKRVRRHIFETAVTEAWLEPNRRAVQSGREKAVMHEIHERRLISKQAK
jgi:hypothetical protein